MLTLRYAIARFEKASELFRFMPTHLAEKTREKKPARRCLNQFNRRKTAILEKLAPRFAFCHCELCIAPDHSQPSTPRNCADSAHRAAMRSQHLLPPSANTHLV